MARLFGTSGIRGVYGKEVTPELAFQVGNALGAAGRKVVIAIDARSTSPLLAQSLSAGAMQAGADVIFAGFAPTPLLAFATFEEKCGGAMITASHNPPEYNGIKLFSCGKEFTRAQEEGVETALGKPSKAVEWNKAGQKIDKDYSKRYAAFLLSKIDTAAIKKRNPRVLLDAGNAAASQFAPSLFREAGCEVVELYCDSPGNFVRNLEPKKETLIDASKAVVESKCDFGIAFDGDGDRAIAIDEKGRVLGLDEQLSVFCSHFLKTHGKKGAAVVSTVEASLCIKETVESLGGKLAITPVGSLHVAEEVGKRRAIFGGEPCGEYVFPTALPCADGLLSALFIAEIFCTRGKLSALLRQVKSYPMKRSKYACEGKDKGRIIAALEKALAFDGATLSKIDGIRLDFEDGWLLVRPSGTEPAIRLTCEFRDQEKMERIAKEAERKILAAIGAA